MKKLLLGIFTVCFLSVAASAQTDAKSNDKKAKVESSNAEMKVKKTTTPKQKVHNIVHPKRKHYSGVKVKAEAKKGG
jgi:hypothetical protein